MAAVSPTIIVGSRVAEKIDYRERKRKTTVSQETYRRWSEALVNVGGRRYAVATKPGVFADGRVDTATVMLAEQVDVSKDDVVVHMNCGNGLAGTVIAASGIAGRVILSDRNVLSVEAARRTLAANGLSAVEVFLGQGSHLMPDDLVADIVAIRIPQEKFALLQLLSDAFRLLRPGGRCYFAGATNEGVKSAAKHAGQIFGNANVLAYDAGHRVVVSEKTSNEVFNPDATDSPCLRPDEFRELRVTLRGEALVLYSRPGVFSWDHLDEATEILTDVMDIPAGASVVDLGCGSGPLGITASKLSKGGHVVMVDADIEAVRSAEKSAAAAGIGNYQVLPSDVAGAVIDERFDVVVTNPPFHVGKQSELSVPLQFIDDAWQVLVPGGRIFLVANRTLPYETPLKRRFGNITTLHDGRQFKVLSAKKSQGI